MHPRRAFEANRDAAIAATDLFRTYAPNAPRVPGMDTAVRMGVRIEAGRSPQQAAAREYVYRWSLAIDASATSVTRSRPNALAAHYAPHALGL